MSLKKWAKRFGLALLTLVLAVAGLWAASRLAGPTDAQETALATMRQPIPPLRGTNAFTTLWQLPYAIPESEREAVFAEDLRRLRRESVSAAPAPLVPTTGSGSGREDGPDADAARAAAAYDLLSMASVAEARYPASIGSEDMARFCNYGEDCLRRVAADTAAYSMLIERHAAVLDRVERLEDYDGIRQMFGYRYDSPPPAFQYGRLPLTRHALLFVQGRREEALDATCRAITTWRRLGAESDTLISRVAGSGFASGVYAKQFARMLAEMPRDVRLPASCNQAFAPVSAAETSLCNALRGEFGFVVSSIEVVPHDRTLFPLLNSKWLGPLFFNEEMSLADMAVPYAFHCEDATRRRFAEDAAIIGPRSLGGNLRLQCASNAVGCLLGEIATPDFDRYAARLQDANAQIRLIAVLLKIRSDVADARPFAERLRASAADIGSSERMVFLDDSGRNVRMKRYDSGREAHWQIPLPPYFHSVAETSAPPAASP
jgi:hypothetical protein